MIENRTLSVVTANVTQTKDDAQKCNGMYSKKSWGGKVEPYIMVKFIDTDKKQPVPIEDPTVGVVIWEWKDSDLLGKPDDVPVEDVGIAPRCARLG